MYLEKQTIIYMVISMLFGVLISALALLPEKGFEIRGELFGETVHIKIGVPEIDPKSVIYDEKNNQLIVNRIKELAFDHTISEQLRSMYASMANPFVSEAITVNVIFSEEISADNAKVCQGSKLYDNRVVIMYEDNLSDFSNLIVIPAATNIDLQACSNTNEDAEIHITINDKKGRELLMLDDRDNLPDNVITTVKVMPVEHRI